MYQVVGYDIIVGIQRNVAHNVSPAVGSWWRLALRRETGDSMMQMSTYYLFLRKGLRKLLIDTRRLIGRALGGAIGGAFRVLTAYLQQTGT